MANGEGKQENTLQAVVSVGCRLIGNADGISAAG
jgi:hypothetical protein